jgi:preprotein translocase subunit SecD
MLYFTRWKAAAIVLTAFVVCMCMVPNFLPDRWVQSWPKWAQLRVVLGLDLQGGSHILLEVDANDVRKQRIDALRDDVRRVLRDVRIGYTGLAVRGNSVEISVPRSPSSANCRCRSAAYSAARGSGRSMSPMRATD